MSTNPFKGLARRPLDLSGITNGDIIMCIGDRLVPIKPYESIPVSADHTILDRTKRVITVDASLGGVSVFLPPVADFKDEYFIVAKIDSSANPVTLDPNGVELISGSITLLLTNQYESVLIFSDGTQWIPLTGGGTTAGGSGAVSGAETLVSTNLYDTTTLTLPRDVVYLSGADFVDKADATDASTMNIIGLIISKPTTTEAIVQYAGDMTGFSSLTPGAMYYVDAAIPGGITLVPPTTDGAIIQRIGIARNTTTLILNPGLNVIEL